MRILIANDDGIYSPGIAALAEVASGFGDVRIVAPDVEQSSMGHAITSRRPVSYRRTPLKNFEAYRVNGTPADCVALGTYLWEGVEVVLSGINLGPNIGNSTWHSGNLRRRNRQHCWVYEVSLSARRSTETRPTLNACRLTSRECWMSCCTIRRSSSSM
jgi:hypothetical protein